MNRQDRTAQRDLAARLRFGGSRWVQMGYELQGRWSQLSSRAAMRIAHGRIQSQAADAWNQRWPDQPKTDKDLRAVGTLGPER